MQKRTQIMPTKYKFVKRICNTDERKHVNYRKVTKNFRI